MKTKISFCSALILGATLVIPLFVASFAQTAELNGKEKALAFLSDVALLDLSKYSIRLVDYRVSYPAEYGGVPEERVHYSLTTEASELSATLVFRNATYAYSLLSWRKGSPIYIQPQPTNLVDFSKGLLERYQNYIGSSRVQPLRAMLDKVGTVENKVVTEGNLKLTVTVHNVRSTGFRWNFDGLETTVLSIALQDGTLYGIGDNWSIFTISDAEVKKTAEDSIDIAVNRARTFSWIVNGVSISGFTVLREHSTAVLTMNVRVEPLVLYPLWRVYLPLDKTYAGGVSAIAVGVWADTGEVSYIQELSYGGVLQDSNATSTAPSDSPSQTPGSTTPDASAPDSSTPNQTPSEQTPDTSAGNIPDSSIPIVAAGVAVAITATAAAAIYVKKKRR